MSSFELVRESHRRTASAVERVVESWLGAEGMVTSWVRFRHLDEFFRSIETLHAGVRRFWVFPTVGAWTLVWTDGITLGGHESLAGLLNRDHDLEVLHVSSCDQDAATLAGSRFSYLPPPGARRPARSVHCSNQGSRWHFEERGEPLPEEDLARYGSRIKRKRLDESGVADLLGRLGARPWREAFYDLSGPVFLIERARECEGAPARSVEEILRSGTPPLPVEEEVEAGGPPGYLRGLDMVRSGGDPAGLLEDLGWCGHGERTAWIGNLEGVWSVWLASRGGVGGVQGQRRGGEVVDLYDARLHPASPWSGRGDGPSYPGPEACRACGETWFRVAVGFAYPPDSADPMDATWFALALKCGACGAGRIAYDDEIA